MRGFHCLAAAAALAATPLAQACSTCGCGDYTITLMGDEKAFAGRLRTSLEYLTRSEVMGGGADEQKFSDRRYNLGLSWSPTADITIAAQVPYVHKHVDSASEDPLDSRGVGDSDLLARITVFRDARESSRHLLGIRLGLKLPTSEEVKDDTGRPIDIDGQPDAGATGPNAGVWYAYYRFPVFVTASAVYSHFNEGRQEFRPGNSLQSSVTGQYALDQNLALQLGIDGRHLENNRFSGIGDPDSGGTLVAISGGAAYRFGSDFVVNAGVQVPVVKDLNGEQDVSPSVRIGMAYDF